jgi:hypothetical protein
MRDELGLTPSREFKVGLTFGVSEAESESGVRPRSLPTALLA